MRSVKRSATLIAALALWVCAGAGAIAQTNQAPPKQTPAPKSAGAAKAEAQTPAKSKAQAPSKAAAKSGKATPKATTKKVLTVPPSKRDPFQPLISKAEPGRPVDEDLGPGPGGVRVSALRLDGVVRTPTAMIAVISTPRQRVYFIREGTRLYDGVVEKITLESIILRERGQDPFGKPLDRQVIKRLYPKAGEQ